MLVKLFDPKVSTDIKKKKKKGPNMLLIMKHEFDFENKSSPTVRAWFMEIQNKNLDSDNMYISEITWPKNLNT